MASTFLSIFSRQSWYGRGGFKSSPSFAHAWRPTTLRISASPKRSFAANPILRATGLTGLGLGLMYTTRPVVFCDPSRPSSPTPAEATGRSQVPEPTAEALPPPPKSSVSVYELSFGTMAGICAGVFVKKGLKIIAFVCGGVFVLLQYMGSLSLIRINWPRINSLFESRFYTKDEAGVQHAPTISSAWGWLVHFLTADFPPRASFLAGFLLGLRVG